VSPCGRESGLSIQLVLAKHHVVQLDLLEGERVVVGLLERHEADRVRAGKRLDEVQEVLETRTPAPCTFSTSSPFTQ